MRRDFFGTIFLSSQHYISRLLCYENDKNMKWVTSSKIQILPQGRTIQDTLTHIPNYSVGISFTGSVKSWHCTGINMLEGGAAAWCVFSWTTLGGNPSARPLPLTRRIDTAIKIDPTRFVCFVACVVDQLTTVSNWISH